jgi:hypothetical protein
LSAHFLDVPRVFEDLRHHGLAAVHGPAQGGLHDIAGVAEQQDETGLRPCGQDVLPDQDVGHRLVDDQFLAAELQFVVEYPVPEQMLELGAVEAERAHDVVGELALGPDLQDAQVLGLRHTDLGVAVEQGAEQGRVGLGRRQDEGRRLDQPGAGMGDLLRSLVGLRACCGAQGHGQMRGTAAECPLQRGAA